MLVFSNYVKRRKPKKANILKYFKWNLNIIYLRLHTIDFLKIVYNLISILI